jgi:hypothetical protein
VLGSRRAIISDVKVRYGAGSAKPVRLPYHRGLFYFGPEYLGSEEKWTSNFLELVEALLPSARRPWSVVDRSGWQITIRFDLTDFTIDARSGTFIVYEHNDEEEFYSPSFWYGPINCPERFVEEISNCEFPEHLESELNHVQVMASELTRQMLLRRRAALRRGYAGLEARFSLVSNDFRRLDADQVEHLRIIPAERDFEVGRDNSKLDDAEGPNHEMFYSFCIVSVPMQRKRAELKVNEHNATNANRNIKYPKEIYNPIIEKCVKDVKRQFGKQATQAEVKRRATLAFKERGLPVITKTVFDERVREIFKLK